MSLAAVAQAVGFSTQSHFTAVFSTRMGASPGAYRCMTRLTSTNANKHR
jgi:AraC-like DNA-binding protein